MTTTTTLIATIESGRRQRVRRCAVATGVLATVVVALFAASLMYGHTTYSPREVLEVIAGRDVEGASFTVGQLRLPRAVLAVVVGACFGMAGAAFQSMLRNPLASPDIIGISAGASAAGVVGIVWLGWNESRVSALAVTAALTVAAVIALLAYADGLVGTRLILIGIAVSAMLDSVVAYVIVRSASWDIQTALRWLTGSLNATTWEQVIPALAALVVFGPVLWSTQRGLDLLRLGDDAAAALGVAVERTRLTVILSAVALIAFATAASGPIAFVAFLAGPIAARIVGTSQSLLISAALVGAAVVLGADLVGQWSFGTRYPVGVITGALGAPYLVYVLITTQRRVGS
ncbi:MAG: iron chelate uptake ABC transporter family permease subunit [Acidimicrobiales bacterium]